MIEQCEIFLRFAHNKPNIIPDHIMNSMRIMTFNVHAYKDCINNIVDPIRYLDVIQHIHPDIICLQEVLKYHHITDVILNYMNCDINDINHVLWCESDYNNFGNLLISRYKIETMQIVNWKKGEFSAHKKNKCYINAKINFIKSGKTIPIFIKGLHIERTNLSYQIKQFKKNNRTNNETRAVKHNHIR